MADTVTSIVVLDDATHHIVHLTCLSDGTGESNVVKVDKSALAVARDGAEAGSLDIETVRWNVQGFTHVLLEWDHDTDDTALRLAGSGYEDFREGSTNVLNPSLKDPRSTGGAGDILLSTSGAVSGATYDITLRLRKNAD